MQLDDATAAHEADTAYRFSWLNATNSTKVYNIVATYSDGTKEILKTVTMKPGSDAVNTGIVKVNGKSVTITTEETEGSSTGEDPDNQGGTGNQGGTSDGTVEGGNATATTLLIIIAALLFVILLGVYAVCLLITDRRTMYLFAKRPAKKKAPAESTASDEVKPE